jgi:integrase
MKRQRRQTGSLWQSHGWWYLRIRELEQQPDGSFKRVQRAERLAPAEGATRSERSPKLLLLRDERMAAINRWASMPEAALTVAQFAEKHCFPHVRDQLRPTTYATEMSRWRNHLRAHAERHLMRDFKTPDAIRILRRVAAAHPELHRSYLRQMKAVLSAIFTHAIRLGVVERNPVSKAEVPPARKSVSRGHYDLDAVRRMLAILPEPEKTMVAVAAFGGLRQSEIQGLRWQDYTGKELYIRQNCIFGKRGEPKTEDSAAPVPVIAPLRQALDAHRLRQGDPGEGLVFQRPGGGWVCLQKVALRMRRVLEAAGLDWRGWHAFRRGLASNLYALGVPAKHVQAILRHSDVNTTLKYYVRTSSDDAIAAMDRLEQAFDTASTLVQ